MPALSPFPARISGPDGSQTIATPSYYLHLHEHNPEAVGVVAEVDLRKLIAVQKAEIFPALDGDAPRAPFVAVYWKDEEFPAALSGTSAGVSDCTLRVASDEFAVSAIDEYLQGEAAVLIGGERCAQELIAQGKFRQAVLFVNAARARRPWRAVHRVVSGVEWFQAGWLVCLAREHLFFRDVGQQMRARTGTKPGEVAYDAELAPELLRPVGEETVTMLAVARQSTWRVHAKRGWADGLLKHHSPGLRELAATQLHEIVLPSGIDVDAENQAQYVRVTASAETSVEAVRGGADVAFVMEAISSAKLRELVQQREMLPPQTIAPIPGLPEIERLEIADDVR